MTEILSIVDIGSNMLKGFGMLCIAWVTIEWIRSRK